ncbi:MAG TPA: BadF/BadG/BcrA/BcrD ATPase family protein [Clostridia bacterium]|nr:BadF/BadG/BcrA/BcrD ATPase family protein [Clostridia bacterium]
MSELLTRLLRAYGGLNATIEGLYAGLAGCASTVNASAMESEIQRFLPNAKRVRVRGDMFNALYSLEGVRDGVSAIAGTGSGAFARVGKTLQRVGGWGYLIDDTGSGFDIGRRVLQSVLRAWDGRGEATLLTDLVTQALDGVAAWQAIPAIYQGGRAKIASFAPLAFQAADAGDRIAHMIVLHAGDAQAVLIQTAARNLPQEEKPYLVVLCGGLWHAHGFQEAVQARLGADYALRLPSLPAVAGCLAAAADLCGRSDRDMLERLSAQLDKEEVES